MITKAFLYSSGLLALVVLGIGLDALQGPVRNVTTAAFNLFPGLAFEIGASLAMVGLWLGLAWLRPAVNLPRGAGVFFGLVGLLLLALPLFIYAAGASALPEGLYNLLARPQLVYTRLAAAMWVLVGLQEVPRRDGAKESPTPGQDR